MKTTITDYWKEMEQQIFPLIENQPHLQASLRDCFYAGAVAQNQIIRNKLVDDMKEIVDNCKDSLAK